MWVPHDTIIFDNCLNTHRHRRIHASAHTDTLIRLVCATHFNSKATPANDTDYSFCSYNNCEIYLTSDIGLILCHITPLVIYNLGGGDTHTHKHTCTHKLTCKHACMLHGLHGWIWQASEIFTHLELTSSLRKIVSDNNMTHQLILTSSVSNYKVTIIHWSFGTNFIIWLVLI